MNVVRPRYSRPPLGEIFDFRNEIVHPKNGPKGRGIFVGLEHIERDTGVRLGSEHFELAEMTGRRAQFREGDVVYGYLRPYLNKVWIAEFDGFCSVDQYVLTVKPSVSRSYVAHYLRSPQFLQTAPVDTAPGQLPRIRSGELSGTLIPLPSFSEQQRIATILDKADALSRKRKRSIELLDSLKQSIFLEMFGDPAQNPHNFPKRTFREVAITMRDGPFGSNLKSEHYVEAGVRVIRLQNIGVGEFYDQDKAFISEEHFARLSKHECLPGDVLVGTLGDPNLRACVQPCWLKRALNKADCVQIRVNEKVALPEFLSALINQRSTEAMAQGIVLGQTRSRISMGRLRELAVPVAPIDMQRMFVGLKRVAERSHEKMLTAARHHASLFASLQHRAFSGQL